MDWPSRALALRGKDTCVLERHRAQGRRRRRIHSGVIHAGLYHPAGSLKGRLCVEGRERLYAFCQAHHVPYVHAASSSSGPKTNAPS